MVLAATCCERCPCGNKAAIAAGLSPLVPEARWEGFREHAVVRDVSV